MNVRVEVRRRGLWWEAWSPAVVNPRRGLTRRAAVRRVLSDVAEEWRTGRPARAQRRPR